MISRVDRYRALGVCWCVAAFVACGKSEIEPISRASTGGAAGASGAGTGGISGSGGSAGTSGSGGGAGMSGSGGASGTSGSAGTGGGPQVCDPTFCPTQTVGQACCTSNGKCGSDMGMGCVVNSPDAG